MIEKEIISDESQIKGEKTDFNFRWILFPSSTIFNIFFMVNTSIYFFNLIYFYFFFFSN